MTNQSDAYLADFYGPESRWFSITVGIISVFIVLSNIFFIIITITSKSLRQKSSTWILIGFAISDFLHGSAHIFDAVAIWLGSLDDRRICSLAGAFVIFTAASSFGFPFLIAADRYYKITIPESGKFSLGKALFSDRWIIPVIVGWFCLSAVSNVVLLFNDGFGEDPGGFCGARKFTEVHILLIYEVTMLVFFVSLVLSAVYYFRLAKWLKQNQQSASGEAMNYTRQIMTVTKIITLIPVFLAWPGVTLTALQMILPEMPMWVKRVITVPYFLSSVANPWLTMALVRPFRQRLLQLLRSSTVSVTESTDRGDINLSSTHHNRLFIQPKSAVVGF
uniref:G-protein coupled receptors family 1 profile domain-containing protein n=1 Tax=Plectus sambesii TaxID=2011161 RepID=A0A914WVE2_9BILA